MGSLLFIMKPLEDFELLDMLLDKLWVRACWLSMASLKIL
jgi:hypothetical protein